MTQKLEGKVAVVTGASKGIGTAIARTMAAEGAAVVVHYRSGRTEADQLVAAIFGEGGQAIPVRADMATEADIRRLFADTVTAFGRLDILVNNAGIYEFAPPNEITPAHFHRQFDLNVLGLILACQEAARYFGPEEGSVINISPSQHVMHLPPTAVYSATKAAVDAVTRSLSQELGQRKIRVNSINPGLVETEGVRAAGFDQADFRQQLEARTPLGRIGYPEDIAPAFSWRLLTRVGSPVKRFTLQGAVDNPQHSGLPRPPLPRISMTTLVGREKVALPARFFSPA